MSRKQRHERLAAERIQAAKDRTFQKIIAVDFDGTLCSNRYPDIGSAKHDTIQALKTAQEQGAALILWSCRTGMQLEEAVSWCADHGLYFDAINDNLEQIKEKFGENPRKVYAHTYLDDRSQNPATV